MSIVLAIGETIYKKRLLFLTQFDVATQGAPFRRMWLQSE